LELAGSDLSIDRATATGMLGTLLQNSNLQPTTRDRVHNGIIKATSDENPSVRISAVIALGKVGTPIDLKILPQIASNDPTSDGVRYPVREAAQRAIVATQKR
jgi:HEAT repeat protein